MECASEESMLQAIRAAERLRTLHNGIGGVYLYLGHDGGNSCELKDIDAKSLVKADSGRSLLEAVERAEAEWRLRRGLENVRRDLRALCLRARARFDGKDSGLSGRTFNTACFQTIVKCEHELELTPDQARNILGSAKFIVPLAGGCHWYELPTGIERDMPQLPDWLCKSE